MTVEIDMSWSNRDTSTVTLAGRRFPAAALICPLAPHEEPRSEYDCSLATGPNDRSRYIPAENGLLFEVEPDHRGTWTFALRARACFEAYDPEGFIWLPTPVAVLDGHLVAEIDFLGTSIWWGAEPDWIVEMIDRWSSAAFTQPEGPHVKLVRLDYFKENCDA